MVHEVVKITETGSRMVVAGGWGSGDAESCSMGIILVFQDEKGYGDEWW